MKFASDRKNINLEDLNRTGTITFITVNQMMQVIL